MRIPLPPAVLLASLLIGVCGCGSAGLPDDEHPVPLETWQRELRHPDAARRLRATEALARGKGRTALQALAEALLDQDERVRRAAAGAFLRIAPGLAGSLELLETLRRERDRARVAYH
ncbi:MAG: HEAT repeat domain-containing protein [Planctomycetota bacterium]